MSEDLVQQDVNVAPIQEPVYTQSQLNAIIGERLAREKAKNQRETTDQPQGRYIDEAALVQKAKQEMIQDLEKHKQDHFQRQKQAEAKAQADLAQAEFDKNASQYISHVSDLIDKVDISEDPMRVFTEKGMKKYADLLVMAGELNLEDTKDIIRELAKRPSKLADLNRNAKDKDSDVVLYELKKISDRLKDDKADGRIKSSQREPLTQLKPSTVGSSSSSKAYTSVSDYKNDPRLRR